MNSRPLRHPSGGTLHLYHHHQRPNRLRNYRAPGLRARRARRSGELCTSSVRTADGEWDNSNVAGDGCPSPPASYFPGYDATANPQCRFNKDCITRVEDCANDADQTTCETFFANSAAQGITAAQLTTNLCKLCQYSETHKDVAGNIIGTTGSPLTFSSKESRVAEGSKAYPRMATSCQASATTYNKMCEGEVLAAQSRKTAQTRAIENMPSYPPSAPPPAFEDTEQQKFCDAYAAAKKTSGWHTCSPTDNPVMQPDGTPYDPPKYDPCCSALANQKCQYGYCLRAVG